MNKKRLFPQHSLSKQLLTGFGLSLVFAGLLTLGINYRLVQSDLEKEELEHAGAITRSLEFAMEGVIALDDREVLNQMVQNYATLPAILEVLIIGTDGKNLAHSSSDKRHLPYEVAHPELASVLYQAATGGVEVQTKMLLHGKRVLVSIMPLRNMLSSQSNQYGLAVVVLDIEQIHEDARQILLSSSSTLAIGAIAILTLMWLLMRAIVLVPLRRLNQALVASQTVNRFVSPMALPDNEIRFLSETFETVFRQHQHAEATLQNRADQLRSHTMVLNQVTKHRAISDGNFSIALQVITSATARALSVERVSVWFYNDQKTLLQCLNLFESTPMQHSEGSTLVVTDYPAYFGAIDTEDQPIVANDALTDPRTYELSESYLMPLNICSMLDVPIRLAGVAAGVLCIEQVGIARQWNPEDESFARSIADLVALAVEARDRKQAELALQQSEMQLRTQTQQLQQALSELQRAQFHLIQSEKMSSLGQTVAGVAHEINNPISFIYGNINYANEYATDLLKLIQLYQEVYPHPNAKIQAEIDAIDLNFLTLDLPKLFLSMKFGAERIQAIVQSLRIFARLDEAEFKTANLHEGLDSTLMILHNRLKAKPDQPEIQIIKEYGELPAIDCYPGQLNQVFMNILTNAIDAVEERNQQLSPQERFAYPGCIRIQTETEGREQVIIRIADNGVGINEQIKAKLFDLFFTTKMIGKGTGLGLSISYQIVVERHGGQLSCHSVLGEGSEFVIELPILQRDGDGHSIQRSRGWLKQQRSDVQSIVELPDASLFLSAYS
ncbi:MAG: GAF domain-containing sensor histidine kinase [Scytolyngbya sp. HA4215-MV1]|nr:GAF domain-containing sensor histidine kinase [Scytolyngbya sp. HA4215-MV1]